MNSSKVYQILSYCIAAVWLINGLICKVFNFTPRHELIVARILGDEYARVLILIIGLAEIGMAFWVLSKIQRKLNAVIQISIVAVMNILEAILAPDLLLWGYGNAVFALLFIILVFYNEFILYEKAVQK